MKSVVRNFGSLLAAVAMGGLFATSVQSALVLNVSTSNSSVSSFAGPSGDRAATNSLSITNAGGSVPDTLASFVTGATRYTSNVAADRPVAFSGGTARATMNTDYTVTVTTNAPLTHTYDLVVNTSILGELTLLDDTSVGNGTAVISDVTGRLNGNVTGGLGLAGIAESFSVGTGVNAAEERNKFAANSINLGSFTGPQSFALRFTFSTEARSPQHALGGDEAAVRLGSSGPLGGANADEYPGPGDVVDRNQSLDGHFVTVIATITAVPEPSSALLLLSCLAGCVGIRRRS